MTKPLNARDSDRSDSEYIKNVWIPQKASINT